MREQRRDVGGEGALEFEMGAERVIGVLRRAERGAIDDQRLRVGALQFDRRLHQALDRVGDVVRLIEHIGGRKTLRAARLGVDQFVEDQEQPERLDRAGVEIVVAIFGIVEMEAAEFPEAHEARDDLLDIDVGRVMAEIDEALRLRAEFLRGGEARSPIGNHGRIEGGLVELVLEEHAPVAGQRGVDLRASRRDSGRARLVRFDWPAKLEPSPIQTVSAFEPSLRPIAMHSILCAIAWSRTAPSTCESEPNL